ncbi:MAG: hypothetical protein HeimC3_52470 [Candidatus Heimdallarchaeota archaeon LC_3]|nr:MAG: hypothetical protein HeimC3_52470 [Candidatus Heimdallarchaeota archaeon LC_3]
MIGQSLLQIFYFLRRTRLTPMLILHGAFIIKEENQQKYFFLSKFYI